jgi:dihydrofolate reductase
MRRLVMWNQVTADGYFAGPDGDLDWVVPDEEFDREVADAIERSGIGPDADTILFGRRTYEQFEAFWSHALDDPDNAPNPHVHGQVSPEMRAMAAMLNEATKLVFSRTLEEVTWSNSHLRRELDPNEIEALKEQPGKDMMIFGSGSIVSQLTQHGLIDEYQFVVMPVLLGGGLNLLTGLSKSLTVDFLEAKEYPSGKVMLRYARAN